MILGLQITAFIFSIVMIYFALLNYRRREIGSLEYFSWMAIWAFTLVVVVFPDVLAGFATKFEFARLFDMMVVGGFFVVLVMVSISYVRVKRTQGKLEDLVKKIALKNAKEKK